MPIKARMPIPQIPAKVDERTMIQWAKDLVAVLKTRDVLDASLPSPEDALREAVSRAAMMDLL